MSEGTKDGELVKQVIQSEFPEQDSVNNDSAGSVGKTPARVADFQNLNAAASVLEEATSATMAGESGVKPVDNADSVPAVAKAVRSGWKKAQKSVKRSHADKAAVKSAKQDFESSVLSGLPDDAALVASIEHAAVPVATGSGDSLGLDENAMINSSAEPHQVDKSGIVTDTHVGALPAPTAFEVSHSFVPPSPGGGGGSLMTFHVGDEEAGVTPSPPVELSSPLKHARSAIKIVNLLKPPAREKKVKKSSSSRSVRDDGRLSKDGYFIDRPEPIKIRPVSPGPNPTPILQSPAMSHSLVFDISDDVVAVTEIVPATSSSDTQLAPTDNRVDGAVAEAGGMTSIREPTRESLDPAAPALGGQMVQAGGEFSHDLHDRLPVFSPPVAAAEGDVPVEKVLSIPTSPMDTAIPAGAQRQGSTTTHYTDAIESQQPQEDVVDDNSLDGVDIDKEAARIAAAADVAKSNDSNSDNPSHTPPEQSAISDDRYDGPVSPLHERLAVERGAIAEAAGGDCESQPAFTASNSPIETPVAPIEVVAVPGDSTPEVVTEVAVSERESTPEQLAMIEDGQAADVYAGPVSNLHQRLTAQKTVVFAVGGDNASDPSSSASITPAATAADIPVQPAVPGDSTPDLMTEVPPDSDSSREKTPRPIAKLEDAPVDEEEGKPYTGPVSPLYERPPVDSATAVVAASGDCDSEPAFTVPVTPLVTAAEIPAVVAVVAAVAAVAAVVITETLVDPVEVTEESTAAAAKLPGLSPRHPDSPEATLVVPSMAQKFSIDDNDKESNADVDAAIAAAAAADFEKIRGTVKPEMPWRPTEGTKSRPLEFHMDDGREQTIDAEEEARRWHAAQSGVGAAEAPVAVDVTTEPVEVAPAMDQEMSQPDISDPGDYRVMDDIVRAPVEMVHVAPTAGDNGEMPSVYVTPISSVAEIEPEIPAVLALPNRLPVRTAKSGATMYSALDTPSDVLTEDAPIEIDEGIPAPEDDVVQDEVVDTEEVPADINVVSLPEPTPVDLQVTNPAPVVAEEVEPVVTEPVEVKPEEMPASTASEALEVKPEEPAAVVDAEPTPVQPVDPVVAQADPVKAPAVRTTSGPVLVAGMETPSDVLTEEPAPDDAGGESGPAATPPSEPGLESKESGEALGLTPTPPPPPAKEEETVAVPDLTAAPVEDARMVQMGGSLSPPVPEPAGAVEKFIASRTPDEETHSEVDALLTDLMAKPPSPDVVPVVSPSKAIVEESAATPPPPAAPEPDEPADIPPVPTPPPEVPSVPPLPYSPTATQVPFSVSPPMMQPQVAQMPYGYVPQPMMYQPQMMSPMGPVMSPMGAQMGGQMISPMGGQMMYNQQMLMGYGQPQYAQQMPMLPYGQQLSPMGSQYGQQMSPMSQMGSQRSAFDYLENYQGSMADRRAAAFSPGGSQVDYSPVSRAPRTAMPALDPNVYLPRSPTNKSRVVAFDLPSGSSVRPVSPQSNVAMKWSEQRRSPSTSGARTSATPAQYMRQNGSPRTTSNLSNGSSGPSATGGSVAKTLVALHSAGHSSEELGAASSTGSRPKGGSQDGGDYQQPENLEDVDMGRLVPILFAAVRHNKFETVERMLRDFPSLVDAIDENNKANTLLHVACSNGYARVAKLLIKHGINVDATNFDGNSPLHLSYQYGRNALVSILISASANENARNKKDQIPAQLLSGSIPASLTTSPNGPR